MENTNSIWKASLKYGLIMALVSIVMTMLFYMLDLTFAKWTMIPSLILSLIVLFLLQRSYRDTYENGFISYGKALSSGIVIYLYAAVLLAIFTYILYAFIDPGLMDKSLAMSQSTLEAKGLTQDQIDAAMKMTEKMAKPGFVTISSFFGSILTGVIMALITSIFVVKKGNPILENEQ